MAEPVQKRSKADEQRFLLDKASNNVKREAFFMKSAFDKDDLKDALKHASDMLNELRTGMLSPKNYYDLFMKVCDELRYLEAYFAEIVSRGKSVVALYQQVQHCGNVLPRLYLLVTIGSVRIKVEQDLAREILKDLVEMTKGVQHPMRGLFLRYYLSTQTKDKLPDTGSEYEGRGGNVGDAIEFVLQNFCEMNRLWVRMQHQGKVRKKKKREKERQQLKILVGNNLVRLSQLDGVDMAVYTETVLPKVLEEVTNCKDHIAQAYLMDCIIQVFPDDFHLRTLEVFLETCGGLHEQVAIKDILISLMDRISNYISEESRTIPDVQDKDNAFVLLNKHIHSTIQGQAAMDVNDILELQVALINFANTCYPDKLEYVDHVLKFSAKVLKNLVGSEEKVPSESVSLVVKLLVTPMDNLSINVLKLKHFPSLMSTLSFEPRKRVAVKLLRAVIEANSSLGDKEQLQTLFAFISPIIVDEVDTPPIEGDDALEEFSQEQQLVARLVSLMKHDDPKQLFAIYGAAKKQFGQGGLQRIRFTLVPLVFAYMQLSFTVEEANAAAKEAAAAAADGEEAAEDSSKSKISGKKCLKNVYDILKHLRSVDDYQDMALRLYLQAALTADAQKRDKLSEAFMERALEVYEDTADSKLQVQALQQTIGTLQGCNNFAAETYQTIIEQTFKKAKKLMKKEDQVRIVCQCSHLFWTGRTASVDEEGNVAFGEPRYADAGVALKCLKHALKIADNVMEPAVKVQLFIDVLNEFMYFFAQRTPKIEAKYITNLFGLIRQHKDGLGDGEEKSHIDAQFKRTVKFIKRKINEGGPDAAHYKAITK